MIGDQPIAHHALLSDCHSAALVDRAGSVEWWCLPRFDSPSVFARLLDRSAGHFTLTASDIKRATRRYLDGTLVLRTTFETTGGMVAVTDALAMTDGVRGHDLGISSPRVLLRRAECTEGRVELNIEFAPRPEYGLTTPLVREVDGGLLARGGATTLRLSTAGPLRIDGSTARGTVRLAAGESAGWAVSSASSWGPPPPELDQSRIADQLADTMKAWRSWEAEHQRYQGPYADLVNLSGRILQGLTYRPTGAMLAAPTTSLPETVGGTRNWDYRYAWIRDASYTLDALWVAACPDEATDFLRFLTTAASSFQQRQEMQIVFGIRGERDLRESDLPWLSGWRNSRPVRTGNEAWAQRQVDVYGELLSAVHRLREQLPELSDPQRSLLAGAADIASRIWREPDHGIWEIRGEPRHYLHSKLMCWAALDRAIDLAGWLDTEDRVEGWKKIRSQIREQILTEGWSDEAGAFTQTLGGDHLDAAALLISIVGLLAPDDPRVVATIDAIGQHLTDSRGLVHRYRSDDGLEGEEGAFLICTFWLAEALARAGRVHEAEKVFERAVSHVNDVGLLAEEVSSTGELLGNFPQALSHIGLINAAWAIGRTATRPETNTRPTDQARGEASSARKEETR